MATFVSIITFASVCGWSTLSLTISTATIITIIPSVTTVLLIAFASATVRRLTLAMMHG